MSYLYYKRKTEVARARKDKTGPRTSTLQTATEFVLLFERIMIPVTQAICMVCMCRMVSEQDILESGDLVVVVSDIVASDNKVRSVQLRHVA